MAPKAVLVGMPGSGKSTIGRRLAKALDVPLLDTDAKIVETTGRSIADIFVEGEAQFRQIEADVVRAALAEHDGVVSLGGGAITTPEVREALVGHTVVYLEISAAEGIRRTSGGATRPLLAGGDPGERFRELMTQRVPLYRQVATVRINTNRRNPGVVVRNIVQRLESAPVDRPQARRRRRPAWRRLPTVLNPAPTTEAPPSPAALARQAEARND
ncbi:shikimate kinase [Mycobacterium antarcticum]|uniref:shikimate kinase n=1 Tax=unclassified Mycolicibacterium TaxID=2636767 RepID=UPI0023847446|nr:MULTISPECIES: shikimate kinase [unclassified Mycolicibacterium]BDX32688.1 shikimate kinase [Mycolicibacterium sp. TUM20985]GLP75896.1 shikimate kinase [Mycolicibacterium sp. TUM20983]GLP83760.1 shikimate kinase [Mycolicibacterium sp. TUM20984]